MRFRKSQRITTDKDYARIRKDGRRITASAFHLQIHKKENNETPSPSHSRIGIIASRRIGNAVVRNRAKRIFREIFRKEQSRIAQGLDVVVLVYPQFSKFSHSQLSEQFVFSCQKYRNTKS